MAIKYCVYKRVKDNIPAYKLSDSDKIKCFDNLEDAEKFRDEMHKKEGGSVYHSGYGAGPGTIDTTFYIKEENDDDK